MKKRLFTLVLCASLVFSIKCFAFGNLFEDDSNIYIDIPELTSDLKKDQNFTLADPAPWNLYELEQVVDFKDPRSVASYYVWAVTRLVDDYDDGMEMMRYLYADFKRLEKGYVEGGFDGDAGLDPYMNERIKSNEYKWHPRSFFHGGSFENGFQPSRPLTLELYYNLVDTETLNKQMYNKYGKLNIVYQIKSYADGHPVNITLTRANNSDKWYVTSATTPEELFANNVGRLTDSIKERIENTPNDTSTDIEHKTRYGGSEPLVFTDVKHSDYFADAVLWAYNNNIANGTSSTSFSPYDNCTRGQVVTFLWRALGCPRISAVNNPFKDVKPADYYYYAVLWATEKGITMGTSTTQFSPDATCSSADIITFLYRAAGIGVDGWYEDAKVWALDSGLLNKTSLVISPVENCPRGAVVTFLERMYNK